MTSLMYQCFIKTSKKHKKHMDNYSSFIHSYHNSAVVAVWKTGVHGVKENVGPIYRFQRQENTVEQRVKYSPSNGKSHPLEPSVAFTLDYLLCDDKWNLLLVNHPNLSFAMSGCIVIVHWSFLPLLTVSHINESVLFYNTECLKSVKENIFLVNSIKRYSF